MRLTNVAIRAVEQKRDQLRSG
jgi:CheY-like chemotaxis protein